MANKQKKAIGQSHRKFKSKLRNQADQVYKGTYMEVIKEHAQFEHVKNMHEKIEDIYSNTDNKVKEIAAQMALEWNRRRSVQPTDRQVQRLLLNTIA
jgi:hypothetical protein